MTDDDEKTFIIIVNGREVEFEGKQISFEQVTALAFPTAPHGASTAFTVTYKRGPSEQQQGSMVEGDLIKVKKGMVFNVTATDKS